MTNVRRIRGAILLAEDSSGKTFTETNDWVPAKEYDAVVKVAEEVSKFGLRRDASAATLEAVVNAMNHRCMDLERWVAEESEITNSCTFGILGKVCARCKCGRVRREDADEIPDARKVALGPEVLPGTRDGIQRLGFGNNAMQARYPGTYQMWPTPDADGAIGIALDGQKIYPQGYFAPKPEATP